MTVTTPISGTFSRAYTGTSYDQSAHQIWSVRSPATKTWKATQNVKIPVLSQTLGDLR